MWRDRNTRSHTAATVQQNYSLQNTPFLPSYRLRGSRCAGQRRKPLHDFPNASVHSSVDGARSKVKPGLLHKRSLTHIENWQLRLPKLGRGQQEQRPSIRRARLLSFSHRAGTVRPREGQTGVFCSGPARLGDLEEIWRSQQDPAAWSPARGRAGVDVGESRDKRCGTRRDPGGWGPDYDRLGRYWCQGKGHIYKQLLPLL